MNTTGQLDAVELEHWRELLAACGTANDALEKAKGELMAVFRLFQRKYDIKPGDQINEDGTIARAEQPAVAEEDVTGAPA